MSEVYKISVAIAMASNHNAVLSALSSGLLGIHTKVGQLEGGFNRLKIAIGGALVATAGVAILETMAKLVEKTKEYSDELVKLERLGGPMSKAVMSGDIARRAFDISQRVPMKVTDLMKIPGATYSIIGEEESMKFWEPMAKFSWVMQSQKDYKGDPGTDLQNVIRAGELSGRIADPVTKQIDPEKLQRWLDLSAKIMAATHNMVNPQTLLGMAQQGGFALRGLTDEGFMTQAIVAQAMGGQRSGTALMSMWQQMAGGTMFTRTAEGMQELGLLSSSDWHTDHGRVILHDDASKRLTKLIGNDPLDLIHAITDNLKKQGVTDPIEQARMIQRGLNRATTQRYTVEQVMNLQQIEAERSRMRQGYSNEGSFGAIMNKSVTANIEALKNAWDNLLMAVAGPNSGSVIEALQYLTREINSWQQAILGMDRQAIVDIAKGMALFGLALTGAGAFAILAAIGPGGWLIGGLGALAVALTDQRFRDWLKGDSISQAINKWFDGAWQAISAWLSSHSIADLITGWLLGGGNGKKTGTPTIDDQGLLHYNRFDPGRSQDRAQYAFSLNVDGERLAQTIIDKMEGKYRYDSNTPAFNGAGSYGA